MDTKKFVTAIERLHARQTVMLRFAEDGMAGLSRLKGLMNSNPGVTISDGEQAVMFAVLLSRDWDRSVNRNYAVTGLAGVDAGWLTQLARDVEDVSLVDDHGAKGLMTKKQKARNEAADKLIDQIATPDFVETLESWEMTLDSRLEELEELPLLKFVAVFKKVAAVGVAIDGWSGRLIVSGVWSDELYTSPEQIRTIIMRRVVELMEQLTAAA